jgi:hypothetical protein
MITNKEHKRLLVVGLRLRDQLGGHHFYQIELGSLDAARWECRDCGVRAILEPDAWATWMQLIVAAPDEVREALMRRSC